VRRFLGATAASDSVEAALSLSFSTSVERTRLPHLGISWETPSVSRCQADVTAHEDGRLFVSLHAGLLPTENGRAVMVRSLIYRAANSISASR